MRVNARLASACAACLSNVTVRRPPPRVSMSTVKRSVLTKTLLLVPCAAAVAGTVAAPAATAGMVALGTADNPGTVVALLSAVLPCRGLTDCVCATACGGTGGRLCLFHASQSIKPEKVNTISAISRCVSISSQIKEGEKDWVAAANQH